MAKISIMSNVQNQAAIRIISESGFGTLNLYLDKEMEGSDTEQSLLLKSQSVTNKQGVKQELHAAIRHIQWTADGESSYIKIYRGDEFLMTLTGSPQGVLLFDGSLLQHENFNADKEFKFECSGTITAWILLRKSNYQSKADEGAEYGAYEDDTRVGARTDVSGSPDYQG